MEKDEGPVSITEVMALVDEKFRERVRMRQQIQSSFREAAEEALRLWDEAITREQEELMGEFPNHSFQAVYRPDGGVSLTHERIGSYTVPASLRISANGKRIWPKS